MDDCSWLSLWILQSYWTKFITAAKNLSAQHGYALVDIRIWGMVRFVSVNSVRIPMPRLEVKLQLTDAVNELLNGASDDDTSDRESEWDS